MIWYKIGLTVFLLILAYQDIKERLISVWLFIPVITLTVVYNIDRGNMEVYFFQSMLSLLLLLFYLAMLFIYIRLREVKFSQAMGLGDIFMFVILALSMPVVNFLAFFVLSLIVAFIGNHLLNQIKNTKNGKIPLAGMQAVCLVVAYWTNFVHLNLDEYLIGA